MTYILYTKQSALQLIYDNNLDEYGDKQVAADLVYQQLKNVEV